MVTGLDSVAIEPGNLHSNNWPGVALRSLSPGPDRRCWLPGGPQGARPQQCPGLAVRKGVRLTGDACGVTEAGQWREGPVPLVCWLTVTRLPLSSCGCMQEHTARVTW